MSDVEKTFTEGQRALDGARSTLGDEAANAALASAALSGDTTAPPGVAPSVVTAIVAAYTASAESMIADAGIDVATLTDVLDPQSLALARQAVINGDTAKVRHLAEKAKGNLMNLSKNEAAFDEFMETNYHDISWERHSNGQVTVLVNDAMMPWESLVQLGGITSKTRVKRRG